MKKLLLGFLALTGSVGLALPLRAFPRDGAGAGYHNWRGGSGTFQRSGSYENSRGGSGSFSNTATHLPGSTTGTRSWTNSRGTGTYTLIITGTNRPAPVRMRPRQPLPTARPRPVPAR